VIVCLTGGIATGKSVVAELIGRAGVPVFDADIIARDLVRPGMPAFQEISRTFGDVAVTAAGELNRQALRGRVFSHTDERRKLEAILHPRIRAELLSKVESCRAAYCVIVVPLFTEFNVDYAFVDRVLVVDAALDVQIGRLCKRDLMSEADAHRLVAVQANRADRLALADDVIDSNEDRVGLSMHVNRLLRLYAEIARRKPCLSTE
jgi:dephospho-CoA kinase